MARQVGIARVEDSCEGGSKNEKSPIKPNIVGLQPLLTCCSRVEAPKHFRGIDFTLITIAKFHATREVCWWDGVLGFDRL